MIMTVIAYLYGRLKDCRPLRAAEIMLLDQSLTFDLRCFGHNMVGVANKFDERYTHQQWKEIGIEFRPYEWNATSERTDPTADLTIVSVSSMLNTPSVHFVMSHNYFNGCCFCNGLL